MSISAISPTSPSKSHLFYDNSQDLSKEADALERLQQIYSSVATLEYPKHYRDLREFWEAQNREAVEIRLQFPPLSSLKSESSPLPISCKLEKIHQIFNAIQQKTNVQQKIALAQSYGYSERALQPFLLEKSIQYLREIETCVFKMVQWEWIPREYLAYEMTESNTERVDIQKTLFKLTKILRNPQLNKNAKLLFEEHIQNINLYQEEELRIVWALFAISKDHLAIPLKIQYIALFVNRAFEEISKENWKDLREHFEGYPDILSKKKIKKIFLKKIIIQLASTPQCRRKHQFAHPIATDILCDLLHGLNNPAHIMTDKNHNSYPNLTLVSVCTKAALTGYISLFLEKTSQDWQTSCFTKCVISNIVKDDDSHYQFLDTLISQSLRHTCRNPQKQFNIIIDVAKELIAHGIFCGWDQLLSTLEVYFKTKPVNNNVQSHLHSHQLLHLFDNAIHSPHPNSNIGCALVDALYKCCSSQNPSENPAIDFSDLSKARDRLIEFMQSTDTSNLKECNEPLSIILRHILFYHPPSPEVEERLEGLQLFLNSSLKSANKTSR